MSAWRTVSTRGSPPPDPAIYGLAALTIFNSGGYGG